ncbi:MULTISPECIES: helix-turn-helix domain-containing protein [unclassified Robiginitalea]|uniref:helix-turn-helix domain-containing protein n=1 Tax=Robiginitalea TaxID=252306 RepID=UPI002349CA14|nr:MULTISPECIES: helix-turn-helix transcriptional regulator [unclassified Robiginitalea]MDC6354133.1 helix-turn-helix transcriptional regulator [Robiginitalea sp. PM2]MDC6374400.1 helix-turn-helix transcriptional regulator [Robiginitalea sp. SP8]
MVNTEDFIGRLERILAYYEQTASGFADAIGVPRSTISHLLSGRNKPSLDFVMKVIRKYPEVDLYWLLNGKGTFPSTPSRPTTTRREPAVPTIETNRAIDKIVIFYSDGTFESYFPGEL